MFKKETKSAVPQTQTPAELHDSKMNPGHEVISMVGAALATNESIASLLAFLAPVEGFEDNPEKTDLKFPTAKLIQATSDELKDRDLIKANPHICFGAIINSMTKANMAEDDKPLEFIPSFLFRTWIRFNARKESDRGYDSKFAPGAVIWKSNDPYDPRVREESQFGPQGEPPLCSAYLNYFSYFPGVNTPIVVAFAKTSYKAGQDLFNLVKTCPNNVYRLGVKVEDKGKGAYAIFTVNISRKATPEEMDLRAKLLKAFYSKKDIIEAHDQAKEETTGDAQEPQHGVDEKGRPY